MIERNDEIVKQLEAGVLAEKPGTNEHKMAVESLTRYMNTVSESEKTVADIRQSQNKLDDDLSIKHTDLELKANEQEFRKRELEIREKELEYRKEKDAADAIATQRSERIRTLWDGAKTAISLVGLAVSTYFGLIILKENDDGKPLVTNHGRSLSNSVFKWNFFK